MHKTYLSIGIGNSEISVLSHLPCGKGNIIQYIRETMKKITACIFLRHTTTER